VQPTVADADFIMQLTGVSALPAPSAGDQHLVGAALVATSIVAFRKRDIPHP